MDMNHFWFDSYTETIIKHERKEKKTKNKKGRFDMYKNNI